MGPSRANQQGTGTTPLKIMMEEFAENGHPVFRCSSPLTRGTLKSKGDGKNLIHHNANADSAELLLETVTALSPLSISGAVAKWYNSRDLPETTKSQEKDKKSRSATRASNIAHEACYARFNGLSTRNLPRMCHERLKYLQETEKLAIVCQDAGFTIIVQKGQFFVTRPAVALEE